MAPLLPDGPVVGLAQTYREAMTLLTDTRDYVAAGVKEDGKALEPFDRLRVNTRAMQLTACLAGITAWLMSQRAAETGEIAREDTRLDAHRLAHCALPEAAEDGTPLPWRLQLLIRRTLALYGRLQRLDRMLGEPA